MTLPFEAKSSYVAALAAYRLVENGVIADEYGRVKLLALARYAYANIHAKAPVRTLADLKGLKISAFSRLSAETLKSLGATPVTMPVTEVYQSLNRGVIDATITA